MSIVQSVLGALRMHELTVTQVDDVAPRLRRLRLSSPTLRGAKLGFGDKVQIRTTNGARTYTPFDVDSESGAFSIVGFVHGDGPGAAWVGSVRPRDVVHAFGPRSSIDVDIAGDVLLLGDATSIGVAAALARAPQPTQRRVMLIVGNGDDVESACIAVGVEARVVAAVDDEVRAALASADTVFLTGGALLIQQLKALSRTKPKTRAYWAPGKRGLD
jgi:NADPH-dependent ferric siderophore reductase